MRRAGRLVSRPIGVFAGNDPMPHGLSEATHRDLLDSMVGDPGLRLAGIGRRRYTGGVLTPQQFERQPPTSVNSREALAAVPKHRLARRSAIGRGRPDTSRVS